MDDRYSRNEGLFGERGQKRVGETAVVIAGAGGLGMPTVQQLAYLGTLDFGIIDSDIVTLSSLNRLVRATEADAVAGTKKVEVARRLIREVNSAALVRIHDGVISDPEAEIMISRADVVFGCLDNDAARLQLTRIAAEHAKPYFDLATDTGGSQNLWWGGRVVLADGTQCQVCLGLLDRDELAAAAMTPEQRKDRDRIYGVGPDALGETGPMVVSINGIVASMAVTEFMVSITGLREQIKNLTYRGDLGVVTKPTDQPDPDCYYCTGLWGTKAEGSS